MIAREQEQRVLLDAKASSEAELVSVIGRRRVGKTYLVDETYGSEIDYSLTGAQHAGKAIPLSNFVVQLEQLTGKSWTGPLPRNWIFAFLRTAFLGMNSINYILRYLKMQRNMLLLFGNWLNTIIAWTEPNYRTP